MKLCGWLASIFGVVYLCFLALCSLSGPLSADSPLAVFSSSIYLSSGGFAEDTTDLVTVIIPADLDLLDQFTSLQSADFSGSTCYDEINKWAAAHPQISVKYSVALPCGVVADNSTTEIDMSSITAEEIPVLGASLSALPKLQRINLGSGTEADHLPYELLSDVVEKFPDIEFTYSLSVLGKPASLEDSSLDLSAMTAADMDNILPLLKCMSKLSIVELGQEGVTALSLEEIAQVVAAHPDVTYSYTGTLLGVEYNLSDTILDLNHIKMDDGGAAVRRVIACMSKLETLDMDYCGVSNEKMAAIREDFPNVDVIWRIWFGTNYSVRTDVEKILASKPSVGGALDDSAADVLKYCTKVKYLDLGHNGDGGATLQGIGDISFVSYMPDLEVFIISMNKVSDISPLASCSKLEYLEVYTTYVSDLSPLSGLVSLHHLNLQNMEKLTDISPIYSLVNLERLWIGCDTKIPAEQVEEFKSNVPNCEVNTTDSNTTAWKWSWVDFNIPKYYWLPRYELLREQLGYNYQEYSFYWLDEKCGDPAPAQYAGMYGKAAAGD